MNYRDPFESFIAQSKKHLLFLLLSVSSMLMAQSPDWTVNASSFEHSMSVTCVVVDESELYSSDVQMIGFFDGEDCVGVGYTETYFPPISANLAFVLAYGNSASTNYTVKVFVNEQIFDAGTLDFSSNGVLGTLDAPYVISPVYTIAGCTDETAYNYNPNAIVDDGSCEAIVIGCTDASAYNFNPIANTDDGTCIPIVIGCMDANYIEYNSDANSGFQNILCLTEIIYGCVDSDYLQFNPVATFDNGSCETTWQEAYITSQEELLNCSSDIYVDMPMGWSIIGCTLSEPKNVVDAVSCIYDEIILIKNYLGSVYLPQYDFNGIGDLQPGLGYQIKLNEGVSDFNLCE